MANKLPLDPGDYIVPLNINGLDGRMLHLPAPKAKNREILLVYGHHSSLERWWELARVLNRYGAVTMPDLPGFGGMDSFYTIGLKPTIDNLADYLAAFIKLRYKRKKLAIVGMGFGFVIVTRMLQRYPGLAKKVTLLVSLGGLTHRDDFALSKRQELLYRSATRLGGWRLPALACRVAFVRPALLRRSYAKSEDSRHKFRVASVQEFATTPDMEIYLWRHNHLQTHFFTSNQLLKIDNCDRRIELPVWHAYAAEGAYLNQPIAEQHLQVVFKDVYRAPIKHTSDQPMVIGDAKSAQALIPPKLRRKLSTLK